MLKQVRDYERRLIDCALRTHDGSRAQAAEALGCDYRYLCRKINQHGLDERYPVAKRYGTVVEVKDGIETLTKTEPVKHGNKRFTLTTVVQTRVDIDG